MRDDSGSKVHDKKCEKSDKRVDDLQEILNLVVTTANLFDDDAHIRTMHELVRFACQARLHKECIGARP